MPACPSTSVPGFSLTGSLNLLVRVRNKRAIDTQVWSLSGNRGNMWQQAHVPINPPGPFQVSQVHSQGATCHLSCPCAMGCRRLPSSHLPPWHRGCSGTGRVACEYELGTLDLLMELLMCTQEVGCFVPGCFIADVFAQHATLLL